MGRWGDGEMGRKRWEKPEKEEKGDSRPGRERGGFLLEVADTLAR